MASAEGVAGISTLQVQRRAKGKVVDKPLCLISFGRNTYPTPSAFFYFFKQEKT